jgi:hypothetical protein
MAGKAFARDGAEIIHEAENLPDGPERGEEGDSGFYGAFRRLGPLDEFTNDWT